MRSTVVLVVVAGCSSAAPPPIMAPPAAPAPAAAGPQASQNSVGGAILPVPAPPTSDPCAGRSAFVVTSRGPIAARWDERVSISGKGMVDVRWCGEGSIAVYRLVVGAPTQVTYEYGPPRVAASGQSISLRVAGSPMPRRVPVFVFASASDGSELRGQGIVESIDDPARVAALAACRKCRGTWARWGMLSSEGCDCPTTDAGKRCEAASDCQGYCLAIDWEVVLDGSPCEPGQRRERLIGKCSAKHLAFGCLATLDNATTTCRSAQIRRRLPTVCRD